MIRIKVTPEHLEFTKLMVYPIYRNMDKPMFTKGSEVSYKQFIKSLPEVKISNSFIYYV